MESAGRFPGCDQATPAPAAAGRTFAPSADGGTPLETSPWLVEYNVVGGVRDVTGAPARPTRPARALHEPGDCTGASLPAPSPRTSFPSRGPGTRGRSRNPPGRATPERSPRDIRPRKTESAGRARRGPPRTRIARSTGAACLPAFATARRCAPAALVRGGRTASLESLPAVRPQRPSHLLAPADPIGWTPSLPSDARCPRRSPPPRRPHCRKPRARIPHRPAALDTRGAFLCCRTR